MQRAADLVGIDPGEAPALIGAKVRERAGPIASEYVRLVSGFGAGVFDFFLVVFSIFFLLRDGPALIEGVIRLAPLDRDRMHALLGKARQAIFAIIYGNIVVAVVQGALGGLAFAVVGLPSPVLWGVVMAVLSLMPLVGAAVIWAPAGIMLLFQGEIVGGVLLLAFGAGVISTIDNVLRAAVVGGEIEIHPLAVFLSVLGGVALFGATGVFLGPVLYVVALAALEMVHASLDREGATVGDVDVGLEGGGTSQPRGDGASTSA